MAFPGLTPSWTNHTVPTILKVAGSDKLNDFAELNDVDQRFNFKGRNYTVKENSDGYWYYKEDAGNPLYAFFRGIMDRIEDCTLQSRETQLANMLVDRTKPDPYVINVTDESELNRIQVNQRFKFDGRIYSVKETIQGRWRVLENVWHDPLYDFYHGITDRLVDFTLKSREERFTKIIVNPDFSDKGPIRIREQRDFYTIQEPGDWFKYKGRNYLVKEDSDYSWYVEEEASHPLYAFYNGVMDRIEDWSLKSREARLSDIVIEPKKRAFQVDLNSTLWYVGLRQENLHPVLRASFFETKIAQNGKLEPVLASQNMLSFLATQYDGGRGAQISIASTGKTDAQEAQPGGSLSELFRLYGITSFGFKAGRDFAEQADNDKLVFRRLWGFRIKAFLKYRILGKTDPETRRNNILIDDRWYQLRCGWHHSINSEEFDMGPVQDLLRCSALLYRLDSGTTQTSYKI